MKIDGEWYCDECGEKLIDRYGLFELYGQCLCENCQTINDITDNRDLQYDGIEKSEDKEDNNDEL